MALFKAARDRAVILILVLAIGVAVALSPFVSGLFGAAVLYVMFVRVYRRLIRVIRPGFAASITLVVALVIIALPLTWLISMAIGQAPDALESLQNGSLLARAGALRIGDFNVGSELTKASGTIISSLSVRAIAFVGGATSVILNLLIAFFGLYYMLRTGGEMWSVMRGYIPFSAQTAEALKDRFFSVTEATLLGTVLISIIQGSLVGTAFWITKLSNPFFWGTVTGFASVLPVLGSGIVWLPATVVLFARGEYGFATVMLVIGAGIASNVDNVIRPLVYRRVSNIHPMITLVGAFAGVKYFGLLGILLGPLAIAYLFELLRFYREEYSDAASTVNLPDVELNRTTAPVV
ncbi:MAG: AI-2E family transporter [bacterium]